MDNTENYAIRSAVINKAINYIFDHIDEEITVDDVAHYCSYSRYHLTRMFKEQTDEALYQFIKRIRLERSAWCLGNSGKGCSGIYERRFTEGIVF